MLQINICDFWVKRRIQPGDCTGNTVAKILNTKLLLLNMLGSEWKAEEMDKNESSWEKSRDAFQYLFKKNPEIPIACFYVSVLSRKKVNNKWLWWWYFYTYLLRSLQLGKKPIKENLRPFFFLKTKLVL